MFCTFEVGPQFRRLSAETQETLAELFYQIPQSLQQSHMVERDADGILKLPEGSLHRLVRGMIRCDLDGQRLFYLEPGDMLGDTPLLLGERACPVSEHPVEVISIDREAFAYHLETHPESRSLWFRYLESRLSIYTELVAHLLPEQPVASHQTLHFPAGSAIVVQGTSPKEVYSLLSGRAVVRLGDQQVGEVLPGELFGAMAVLSSGERNASVIAETECMVLSVDKDSFLSLAQSHPSTLLKLINDMGRRIEHLNEEVIALRAAKGITPTGSASEVHH